MPYVGNSFSKRGPYISHREIKERQYLERFTTAELQSMLFNSDPKTKTRINRILKSRNKK